MEIGCRLGVEILVAIRLKMNTLINEGIIHYFSNLPSKIGGLFINVCRVGDN